MSADPALHNALAARRLGVAVELATVLAMVRAANREGVCLRPEDLLPHPWSAGLVAYLLTTDQLTEGPDDMEPDDDWGLILTEVGAETLQLLADAG